jgi:hypothetical protein
MNYSKLLFLVAACGIQELGTISGEEIMMYNGRRIVY